jgi:hypothetical protein
MTGTSITFAVDDIEIQEVEASALVDDWYRTPPPTEAELRAREVARCRADSCGEPTVAR